MLNTKTSPLKRSTEKGIKPCGDENGKCEMGKVLEILTGPWTLHIIWLLTTEGPMRFGALRKAVAGISARILTVRLRTLEEQGFVTRHVFNSNPPEVTYSPTDRLQEMRTFMHQLHLLAKKWHAEDLMQEQLKKSDGSL